MFTLPCGQLPCCGKHCVNRKPVHSWLLLPKLCEWPHASLLFCGLLLPCGHGLCDRKSLPRGHFQQRGYLVYLNFKLLRLHHRLLFCSRQHILDLQPMPGGLLLPRCSGEHAAVAVHGRRLLPHWLCIGNPVPPQHIRRNRLHLLHQLPKWHGKRHGLGILLACDHCYMGGELNNSLKQLRRRGLPRHPHWLRLCYGLRCPKHSPCWHYPGASFLRYI